MHPVMPRLSIGLEQSYLRAYVADRRGHFYRRRAVGAKIPCVYEFPCRYGGGSGTANA